jgi:hypothetical protein
MRSEWRLPGYRIEQSLGAGSSGDVWRARVVSTGVPVALKRIWLSDAAQRKSALSEAAMLSTLDHPHLMKLHEVRHLDDEAIVLVLDLAAGGSLAALLARRGRLTVGETIAAIAPIGAALAYAHQSGIVHGDVSSANILFTDIGLPLLADLGVARLRGDSTSVRTTPAYVDPVVAAGSLPMPASDVFMLGAVALHALTGTPAWCGTDPAQVFDAAALDERPDFAGRLSSAGIPEPVAEVVRRALRIDPAQRGTAADFALELRTAARPVAVELSAGRVRPAPLVRESWPLQSVPAGEGTPPGAASEVPFVGEPPLTYGVRAPSPFASPPGRHLARSRPRIARGLVVGLIVLALASLALFLFWPSGRPSAANDVPVAATPASLPSAPESIAPSPPATPSQIRAILARLDAARGLAYARRDPRLLVRVYASARLVQRDRSRLRTLVPSGCALRGLHSTFESVRVTGRTPSVVHLQAQVAVAAARLTCAGMSASPVRGSSPVPLSMTLVRRSGRWLIAADQRGRS